MRKLFIFLAAAASLAACGGESGLDGVGDASACSNDGQKQYVLDNLYYWYLWNDLLPANLNIADYASPEQLATSVTETYGPQKPGGGPLDRFSSVGSLQADQQYFGEGKYEGFGFSWRLEGPDMRFTRVFVSSPANAAGFARGQTVVSLDGRSIAAITAAEGINAALDNNSVEFEIQNVGGGTFTTTVTKDIVTIDPIPQAHILAGTNVGYMELATFISTADPRFQNVFATFAAAGVEDVIIDMRYNGGGLVATANLLGDYLGGFNNDGQVFSNTEFNADRSSNNSIEYFENTGTAFDLRRMVVIASRGTASASELLINGLDPMLAEGVYIVGDDTFGKPVGQIGLEFCEKILRPTSFKISNAAGFGDYFDGLPVDCAATDTLDIAVGDAGDPNIAAALSYFDGTGCPIVALPGNQQKAATPPDLVLPDLSGAPEREFAGAF